MEKIWKDYCVSELFSTKIHIFPFQLATDNASSLSSNFEPCVTIIFLIFFGMNRARTQDRALFFFSPPMVLRLWLFLLSLLLLLFLSAFQFHSVLVCVRIRAQLITSAKNINNIEIRLYTLYTTENGIYKTQFICSFTEHTKYIRIHHEYKERKKKKKKTEQQQNISQCKNID